MDLAFRHLCEVFHNKRMGSIILLRVCKRIVSVCYGYAIHNHTITLKPSAYDDFVVVNVLSVVHLMTTTTMGQVYLIDFLSVGIQY